MKRGFGWKRDDKYTHAKLISDTLALLRNSDSPMMRGRDVVEVVESALCCLKIALIERGQVSLKGIGTIVIDATGEVIEYRFVPTPDARQMIIAAALSSSSLPSSLEC